jgi:hypothetical protein
MGHRPTGSVRHRKGTKDAKTEGPSLAAQPIRFPRQSPVLTASRAIRRLAARSRAKDFLLRQDICPTDVMVCQNDGIRYNLFRPP